MAGKAHTFRLLPDEENQKSSKEVVATFGWLEDLPTLENTGQPDWTKINIEKSKFSMLKSIEMRHPEHPSCKAQLHPAEEQDLEVTFTLEENEEFVGFQFFEVKNSETGASEWYHPHVLIRTSEKTYVEPLSRHFFSPAPFPGRRRWLPATAKPTLNGPVKGDEVIGLRTMPGQACSHVVGVLHKTSFCSCNVQSITGQSMMFWFDQVVLVLFYADVALDLKQLKLFCDQDLVDYMAFNAFGLLIPPVVTMLEALEWSRTPSPELSFFQSRIQSEVLQKIIIVAAVASQSHVLLLVMLSIKFRSKHPLLRGAKDAEVAESTISALVQTNFLVSFFAEVDAIAKLALTDEQLQSMAISVAVSCLSAGLSFAGRDKSDGMVLSLPGKVGWGPTMGCLVLVRAMEVASRILAFNIIQVSMRGGWCGHVGGPLAVFIFVLASRLCFPEAKLVDVLAPRICVRDSASGADLGAAITASIVVASSDGCVGCAVRSLMLHGILALAAGGQQVLLRTHRAWMPSDAKELPPKYLVGWVLITACSFLGLICLSVFGRCLKQPVFSQLRGEQGEKDESITLSSLVAAFDAKDSQVPKAVVAALGDTLIDIDTNNKKSFEKLIDYNDLLEVLRNSPLEKLNFEHCSQIPSAAWQKLRGASWTNLREANFYRCFGDDTKGADGAADLLEVLRNSPLEKLNFVFCSQIPPTAWQKLRGASWANLREAIFSRCFDKDTKGADGAADLLEVLRNSPLETLYFYECSQIPSSAWQKLRGASWTNLGEASFGWCFGDDTKGADGAADLLEVLRDSPLEKLDFSLCSQIPSTAWQRVPSGAWPALHDARGIPEEELSRIVLGGPACSLRPGHCGYGAAMALEETGKDAQDDENNTMAQTHLQVVFAADIEEAAAFELLNNLCHSSPEKLNFYRCSQIPSAAWQKLRGASWTNLREANFEGSFNEDTKGADGAADLLEVLRNSPLEKLNFGECYEIPSAAWQKLHGASWTNLGEASFGWCFYNDTKGADGAADLLEVLRHSPLEKLNFMGCSQIPSSAWQKLRGASWPNLREANFYRCFDKDTKNADGAADLLEVLRNSPLEKLGFNGCSRIPSTAWQKLRGASWTNLREANFPWCFDKDTKSADGAADLLEVFRNSPLEKLDFYECSRIPSTAWQKLRGASWTNLREASFSACFDKDTKGADGAADLLEVLRNSPLEKLDFENCSRIPSTAWQKLRGASWTNLKEASFSACFDKDTKGADGAADLLEVLRNSPLEKLNFENCSQIPSTAWQRVPSGAWPALRDAPGMPGKELHRIRGGDV
eukprot:symbB.v1.2.004149.t1/scaffold235.1/size321457/8